MYVNQKNKKEKEISTPVLCWFKPPLVAIAKYRLGCITAEASVVQNAINNKWSANKQHKVDLKKSRTRLEQSLELCQVEIKPHKYQYGETSKNSSAN